MEDNCGGRSGFGNYLGVCAEISARTIQRKIHSTNNNKNNNNYSYFLHYVLDIKYYGKNFWIRFTFKFPCYFQTQKNKQCL